MRYVDSRIDHNSWRQRVAKASLSLPNGTTVQIEGTSDEVAKLLDRFSEGDGNAPGGGPRPKPSRKKPRNVHGSNRTKRTGPVGLIKDLAKEGFFKTRKRLGEIQKKLEEHGHIYAQTSLSPAVLSLTKQKVLRRLNEGKGWAYVRGSAEM
jgi:hypothetical protein